MVLRIIARAIQDGDVKVLDFMLGKLTEPKPVQTERDEDEVETRSPLTVADMKTLVEIARGER